MVFFRVITNVLNGSLTVGDVAMFGGATARLRFSLEGTIRSPQQRPGADPLYLQPDRVFQGKATNAVGAS